MCFQTNGFSWLNGSQVLESGYGHSYLVTDNVTISEVGGQNYSCVCEENNQRQCFLCLGYELSIVYVNPCPILDKGQVLYLVYVSYLGIVYVIASQIQNVIYICILISVWFRTYCVHSRGREPGGQGGLEPPPIF